MVEGRSRAPVRIIACILLVIAAAWALAACDDEDGDEEGQAAQTLTFALEGKGATSTRVTVSRETARPGRARIRLINGSTKEGELQLVRVEGEHSPEEAAEGLAKAIEARPLPDWFFAAGGVGPVPSGELATVTQVLEPGTYYPFDTTTLAAEPLTAVVVEGEESDEELEADVVVSAIDYGYEIDELSTGPTEIAFENAGAQPHNLRIAPLLGDSTAEDAKRFFRNEEPRPPLDEEDAESTPVIEAGESQLVEIDLEPGRYVLFCTVSDRKGGYYHSLKGMVEEVEVE